MIGSFYNTFHERVEQAAEAVLKRNGSVGPLDLFQEMRLLQPVHVEGWRKGNEQYRVLEKWIQVGPEKFQKTINHFQEWVKQRGLRPIEAGNARRGLAGIERLEARALVREKIDQMLAKWSASERSKRAGLKAS